MAQHEPSQHEIRQSYSNPDNVRLARAIHPLTTHCAYDRHAAHRHALRLIAADPQNGEDVARAMNNRSAEIGSRAYHACAWNRRNYDTIAAAYQAWRNDAALPSAA